ncbi:hypothetical protein AB0H88_24315 [Nonomuraea sp. NPDC050680]|uniref:hypothetical protein n=1 Tax=Nonomuraea sp. NPDC050680 TaxID=3154630 RepID=UPI0034013606
MSWLALPAIVAAAVGCGASGGSDPNRITVAGRDPQILIHHHSEIGMQALLTGKLVYISATKCLVVKNPDIVVPLWPEGTEPLLENGKRGARLPGNGPVLLEGTDVRISGGYVDRKPGLKLPKDCVADSAIFEVNPFTPVG